MKTLGHEDMKTLGHEDVVDVVDVSGETEVGDLHHVVFGDQNVPGCQVSVDALRTQGSEVRAGVRGGRHQLPDLGPAQRRPPRPAPVLQAHRPARAQELPEVALRGVLHHHVQGACGERSEVSAWTPHVDGAPLAVRSPPCVHAPSRLMMFLCLPIIFIISISEIRSDRSFSVASAAHTTTSGQRSNHPDAHVERRDALKDAAENSHLISGL
ncbi:hypothetical protein EYF80_033427 [Liparis tanakae]|uniref:Uncharacterized protein n=1 Tax=Liparis tanakae TaxID=230148 RepID=A0A4Z2GS67_9TELE|nr:hypothetical protein EYF80_033427 [Liparis tanakae]